MFISKSNTGSQTIVYILKHAVPLTMTNTFPWLTGDNIKRVLAKFSTLS